MGKPRAPDRTVLDNGVRILSSFTKGEIAAFGIGFNHGAIFDPPEYDGLTHGVEHFLVKGAPGYPYRRASRLLEERGAVTAQTTKFRILIPHQTNMGGRKSKKNFRGAFRVLSKLVSQPTFSDQELALEKEAIIREIETTEADPSWQAYEYLYETIFGKDNPLARTIIGNAKIVHSIGRATLIRFYGMLFDPSRIIIVSRGPISHMRLVRATEAFFRRHEQWIKKQPEHSRSENFDYRKVERAIYVMPREITLRPTPLRLDKLPEDLGGVAIGCKIPNERDKRYTLELLNCIIGGNLLEDMRLYSGDLFYELREKRGLIYHPDEIACEFSPWSGCFYLRFQTNQGLLEQAEEATLGLFRSYGREGISRAKIESAVKKLESQWRILRAKYDFQYLDWMLRAEIEGDATEPEEFMKRIRAVTRREIMEMVEQCFDPEKHLVRALVYPTEKSDISSRNTKILQ